MMHRLLFSIITMQCNLLLLPPIRMRGRSLCLFLFSFQNLNTFTAMDPYVLAKLEAKGQANGQYAPRVGDYSGLASQGKTEAVEGGGTDPGNHDDDDDDANDDNNEDTDEYENRGLLHIQQGLSHLSTSVF